MGTAEKAKLAFALSCHRRQTQLGKLPGLSRAARVDRWTLMVSLAHYSAA